MSEFPNCEIKLCDLEVSRVIQEHEQIREIIGTPDYVGNLACIQICYFDYQTIIFSSWDSGVWANQSCSGHLVTGSVGLCPAHGILTVWRWDHYFYEEMIKLFFAGETDQETLRNITSAPLDFPAELFEGVSDEAKEFIKDCLSRNPK